MADPTNISHRGIIDWAKQNPGSGSNSGNSINADLIDGKEYVTLKNEWQAYADGVSGGATEMDDLTDVQLEHYLPLALGDVLMYIGTGGVGWTNTQNTLGHLMDVDVATGLTDGDVLTYNSTSGKWENASGGSGTTGRTIVSTTEITLNTTTVRVTGQANVGAQSGDTVIASIKTNETNSNYYLSEAYVSGAYIYVEIMSRNSSSGTGSVIVTAALIR